MFIKSIGALNRNVSCKIMFLQCTAQENGNMSNRQQSLVKENFSPPEI